MYDKVLIRYGDLMLKGKNRKIFINQVNELIKQNTRDLNVKMIKKHDRVYLEINDTPLNLIEERLLKVTGLHSFSYVKETSKDLDNIIKTAITLINKEVNNNDSFKINIKRADKRYPLTSPEITKEIAPKILSSITPKVIVDMHNPKETLTIEIKEEGTYLFLKSVKALGGFPTGSGGKAGLLLSGGIDSPVAAFLTMKQGVVVEGLHFESTPLTPVESLQKIIEIGKKLAVYAPRHKFRVVMIPFTKLHQEILTKVSEPYVITIMRRMMFRIAEKLAYKRGLKALVTGESIGQVASQTLESIEVIESVTKIPILRPLITYDKKDIISVAEKIDTMKISVMPFEDCCTIYVPKNPVTKPSVKQSLYNERFLDNYEDLIDEIVNESKVITITPETNITLAHFGFSSQEIWEALKDDNLINQQRN